jgi:L-rhamnose isomerase/sugar isomerase
VEHNIECIELGRALGSKALTVWVGDGANFPGQHNLRGALERYLDSMRSIYGALPVDWNVFIEHKLFEPAFYATTIADWGTSFACATALGPKAKCLVDLGHHAPNTNIEMIVARLAQFGKLGGFHFNDSKYGDDDLDSGSDQSFPAVPGLQRAGRCGRARRPGLQTRPTCWTSRTTSPTPSKA